MTDVNLEPWELAQRGVPYHPIRPVLDIYTHIGEALHHGDGRRLAIRLIIDHTTEGSSTSIVGSMRYDARRAEQVSTTAFTGEDGIGYDVDEHDRPFTTGRWNDESLSNETVGRASWTELFWRESRPETIGHKIDLFTDWCRRYAIPAVWLSAEEIARGASRQGETMRAGTVRGICDHYEANRAAILLGGDPAKYSHHDVGPGMRAVLINTIIPAVAARLTPPTPDDEEDNDMLEYVLIPKGTGVQPWWPWLACYTSGTVRPLGPGGANVPQFVVTDLGQYRRMCHAAGIQLLNENPA